MMERITLRLFWIAMVSCASLVASLIWAEERAPEYMFKIAANLFIVGLANFLIWLPLVTYRFLHK